MRNGWFELFILLCLATVLTPLLGEYCACVLSGRRVPVLHFLRPFEVWAYRVIKADQFGDARNGEMDWKEYAFCAAMFCALGVMLVTVLNGAHQSHLMNLQKAGLELRYFVSAATVIAFIAALARGVSRRQSSTIGNFWGDLVRATLYILLPISIIGAVLLVGQGMAHHISHHAAAYSGFILRFFIVVLPSSLAYAFWVLVNKRRRGVAIIAALLVVLLSFQFISLGSRAQGHFAPLGMTAMHDAFQDSSDKNGH
jgi:K+-transporting ATPase A subunit